MFERSALKTAAALVLTPGVVAREYVDGRRARRVHPLTLLLVVVALMVLTRNAYFTHFGVGAGADPERRRMTAPVPGYGNWSFSLGLLAIRATSMTEWRRRAFTRPDLSCWRSIASA